MTFFWGLCICLIPLCNQHYYFLPEFNGFFSDIDIFPIPRALQNQHFKAFFEICHWCHILLFPKAHLLVSHDFPKFTWGSSCPLQRIHTQNLMCGRIVMRQRSEWIKQLKWWRWGQHSRDSHSIQNAREAVESRCRPHTPPTASPTSLPWPEKVQRVMLLEKRKAKDSLRYKQAAIKNASDMVEHMISKHYTCFS